MRLTAFLALLTAALIGLSGCGATPSEQSAALDPIALWRDGPHLRGANLHQRRVYPDIDGVDFFGPGPLGPPVLQEDFDRLSASGANYVQLSHPGVYTENAPHVLDVEALANLDRLLRMAAEADLYAVIAFRTGPGRSEFTFHPGEEDTWYPASYVNNAVWIDEEAKQGWVDMWRFVAQRYSGAAIVAGYELMVEPNGATTGLRADDPGDFAERAGGGPYDWGELYPRILAGIREVDDRTPVIVGAQGWSAPEWLPLLPEVDDERLVYAVHLYGPHGYTHQERGARDLVYPGAIDLDYDGEVEPFDYSALEDILRPARDTALERETPLAVTEYGTVRWAPGAPQYIRDLQQIAERSGLNTAIWGWMLSWPRTRILDDFDFFRGPEEGAYTDAASPLGQAVRDHWRLNSRRPSDILVDTTFGLPAPADAPPVSPIPEIQPSPDRLSPG